MSWGAVVQYLEGAYALIARYFEYILAGAGVTIALTAISITFGLVLGTVIALGRLSRKRLLHAVASAYVQFFRGTPLLVQLLLVFMGLPVVLGAPISPWSAGIIALSLNSAAYVAEIVRAGIQGVGRGQREAGLAIGLRPWQVMRLIVLPQAFRLIVPPLGNEFVALLKDSSLVMVISLEELLRRSQIVVTRTFRPIEIYAFAAILYLIMTTGISLLVGRVERALDVEGKASVDEPQVARRRSAQSL